MSTTAIQHFCPYCTSEIPMQSLHFQSPCRFKLKFTRTLSNTLFISILQIPLCMHYYLILSNFPTVGSLAKFRPPIFVQVRPNQTISVSLAIIIIAMMMIRKFHREEQAPTLAADQRPLALLLYIKGKMVPRWCLVL